MSQMTFSFSDDVGKQIDDAKFQQQFFQNKRGYFNHGVDPFARPNLVNEPHSYRHVFPQEAGAPPANQYETQCCNNPTNVIVTGRKSEDAPLENSSLFWTDLQTPHCCRIPKTTRIIGLNETENNNNRYNDMK